MCLRATGRSGHIDDHEESRMSMATMRSKGEVNRVLVVFFSVHLSWLLSVLSPIPISFAS